MLAELGRKYFRDGVGPGVLRTWLQGISEATEAYPTDIELAIESAKAAADLSSRARRERIERSGLGDALVLATARVAGAKVLTGDPRFRGLEETAWLGG